MTNTINLDAVELTVKGQEVLAILTKDRALTSVSPEETTALLIEALNRAWSASLRTSNSPVIAWLLAQLEAELSKAKAEAESSRNPWESPLPA